MSPRRLTMLIAIMTCLALCMSVRAKDMVNILKNPGFEQGMPEPWGVYHTGDYKVIHDAGGARSGEYYASFAWRKQAPNQYNALYQSVLKVHPGVTYEVSIWAKGTGQMSLWIVKYSEQGQFQGTDFGEGYKLTGEWQRFSRTWTASPGIHGANLSIRLGSGVAHYDDVSFVYDGDKFTPPEAQTLDVVPEIKATDAEATVTLNGKPLDGPAKIVFGEYVIGIEAQATGDNPRVSGSVRFGEYVVELDERWRAGALPKADTENSWQQPGFDDRKWQPVSTGQGIWHPGGLRNIALRRALMWKSSRQAPHAENQWVSMMRDAMYVAEGSAGGFVHKVPLQQKIHATELTLHLEAPAFLTLLDRFEQASGFYSNYAYKDLKKRALQKNGVDYVDYEFIYKVPDETRWAAYAPMYFQAPDQIDRREDYTFTFWREWNGNVSDVPTTLPITVVGPVNGRQCDYFHLTYNRPVIFHSGGFGTFSIAEREAMADTLIATGMNVSYGVLTEQNGVLDYFRDIQKRGVQLAWGDNIGMNWPGDPESRESAQERARADHPELRVKFYDGPKAAFENGLGFHYKDMTGKTMWCHEYAAMGGSVYYDPLRPRFDEAKAKLGDILYTFWDWEYDTLQWSCFCDRCKAAFGEFAKVDNAVALSDEFIVTKHPGQWIDFRLEQSARQQLSMMKFLEAYDILVTNWRPGTTIKSGDFNFRLLGDKYDYHFMGWPGSQLPYLGRGRGRDCSTKAWKEMNPDVHLVAQTIVDSFPGDVIDERMFKIWTLNIALGTYGGGWVLWLDAMYPLPQSHGMSYFMGEATRLIHDHEPYFMKRKYITEKFQQQGLAGTLNELIAVEGPDGKTALVLLFNQDDKPAAVTVTVKDDAAAWMQVRQWEGKKFDDVGSVSLTVPPKDVVALIYR